MAPVTPRAAVVVARIFSVVDMGVSDVDAVALSFLLKASTKKVVLELCRDVHQHIYLCSTNISSVHKMAATSLLITEAEASQLTSALEQLIRQMMFKNMSSTEEVAALFPDTFHSNLKDLLVKILVECSYEWRTNCINTSVSLPRLVDFNYRMDLQMSADSTEQVNFPTCILDLKIADPLSDSSGETVNVELSREKLDTMLHGLGRIRDQLSAVAKK